jgi:membrane-associated HD superfamily phosphohydrolase
MGDGFKKGFDVKSEILYKQESRERRAIQTRKTFVVLIIIYLLFVAFDIFLNVNNLTYILFLRYALLPALLLITIVFSYIDFLANFYQKIILISLIVMGSTAAIMLILYPDSFSYYGGVLLVIFSGYLILEMDFVHATIGGWFISL